MFEYWSSADIEINFWLEQKSHYTYKKSTHTE